MIKDDRREKIKALMELIDVNESLNPEEKKQMKRKIKYILNVNFGAIKTLKGGNRNENF